MFRGNSVYSVKEQSLVVGDHVAFTKNLFKQFPDAGWHFVGYEIIKGKVIDMTADGSLIRLDRSARYEMNRFIWVKLETMLKNGLYRRPWRHPLTRELEMKRFKEAHKPRESIIEYTIAPPQVSFYSDGYNRLRPRPVLTLTSC